MPPHDRLFKSLLRAFLTDLLRLVAPGVAARLRRGPITFLDKELLADDGQGGRREADLLARMSLRDGGILLVHVEIEARARRSMPKRLRTYALRIQSRYDGPLLTILLNLRGGTPGIQRVRHAGAIPEAELFSFPYVTFGLAGCEAADYLERPEPLAWGLAALMRPGAMSPAEHKLACLRRITAARLDRERKLLLINFVEEYLALTPEQAGQYKLLSDRNPEREARDMWMPWSERMKAEGRKEGVRLGRQEGLEKGLEKGLQKGQVEGKLAGMRELLLHLLAQRFGPPTEGVRRQVEAITSPRRLTSLAGKVLTARSLRDLGFC